MPAYTEYFVQLVNARTKMPINDDTGKFIVMTVDTPTLAAIYSDSQGTAPAFVATNVASTMTDGIIRFFTAQSVESVDLTVVTAGGQSFFIKGLTPSQHRYEVDTSKREQLMIFPYYNFIPTPFTSASITATASIWGNGLSIPANTVTKDCYCRTSTLGTAQLLDIGVSAIPSGLLQKVTADATGYHVFQNGYLATGGTTTFAIGTLLCTATGIQMHNYVNAAATALVFKTVTSTTLAAATGWVYIEYEILPV